MKTLKVENLPGEEAEQISWPHMRSSIGFSRGHAALGGKLRIFSLNAFVDQCGVSEMLSS